MCCLVFQCSCLISVSKIISVCNWKVAAFDIVIIYKNNCPAIFNKAVAMSINLLKASCIRLQIKSPTKL